MNQRYVFRMKPGITRGLMLVMFSFLLAACGGDADDPTPTTTSDDSQVAQPTVPMSESTPESDVSEDDITVLPPQVPATAESEEDSATAEVVDLTGEDQSESTPVASPADLETVPANDDNVVETEATPPTEEDVVDDEPDAEPTERVRTGNETFDHPGDGTGGSGMPGELDSGVTDGEEPQATPAASPIAQLSITGCEVPDVPSFVGETTTFLLTADVNFRSGPGTGCEPLLDVPLGEGQLVQVIGGPVIQAEDDSEWVQIDIDGVQGWITTEFIEPAE